MISLVLVFLFYRFDEFTAIATIPLQVMPWQAWLAIAVTIAAFLGNALTPLPPDIVFLGAAAVLFLSGVLDEKNSPGWI